MKAILINPSEVHVTLSRTNLERILAQLNGDIEVRIPGMFRVGDMSQEMPEPTVMVLAVEDEQHYPPTGRVFSPDRQEHDAAELFKQMRTAILTQADRYPDCDIVKDIAEKLR